MKIEQIKKVLDNVFILVDEDKPTERYCFYDDIMTTNNVNYPIYQAIAEAQRESGLTFDFSYKIAKKAVDMLIY